ncbi:hypothetical protein [Hymenobacter lapidiphilus]|uniref:Uncharacterized protein n=1 Tax=Hymenobacter lapidiphilus TaxID=2608003 RepID=A0A7Y7U6Y3_9BACT|nr:hypothetical protein [Hymenobacter lapidiphilus]NVO32877.1 hypothetical protein [Hymenobacter lapidiphilus]
MRTLLLDETKALGTAFQLLKYAGIIVLVLLGVPIVFLAKKALSQNSSTRGAGFALLLLGICGLLFLIVGVVVFFADFVSSH